MSSFDPSSDFAVRIISRRDSGSAVVYRSGNGAWSRSMNVPLRGRFRVQPVGTAWSPLHGVVCFGTEYVTGNPGRPSATIARHRGPGFPTWETGAMGDPRMRLSEPT